MLPWPCLCATRGAPKLRFHRLHSFPSRDIASGRLVGITAFPRAGARFALHPTGSHDSTVPSLEALMTCFVGHKLNVNSLQVSHTRLLSADHCRWRANVPHPSCNGSGPRMWDTPSMPDICRRLLDRHHLICPFLLSQPQWILCASKFSLKKPTVVRRLN